MSTSIFVDLNVIMDVLLERSGFEASSDVIQLGEKEGYKLYISAHMVTTFGYLLENAKVPRQKIIQSIGWLLNTFTVIPVDDSLLSKALKSNVHDYEDAVVEQAAYLSGSVAIITRNDKDFKTSVIKSLTPEEYMKINGTAKSISS